MNKIYYFIIALILLLVGIFFSFSSESKLTAGQSSQIKKAGINSGEMAYDFSLKTIEGKTIKLSDFRGQYVLFAFMSPSCGTCWIEAENVKKAQEEKKLAVIQIDINPVPNQEDLIKIRENFGGKDWFIASDNNWQIANLYQVKSFDTTLVLNPQGEIIYRDDGWPIRTETLKNLLE